MTTPEHSPLPWSFSKMGGRIDDANGEPVVTNATGNMRFIIAAVNTRVDYAPLETKYAELLAAAKMFLEKQDRFRRAALQAAIDKAEEA